MIKTRRTAMGSIEYQIMSVSQVGQNKGYLCAFFFHNFVSILIYD